MTAEFKPNDNTGKDPLGGEPPVEETGGPVTIPGLKEVEESGSPFNTQAPASPGLDKVDPEA